MRLTPTKVRNWHARIERARKTIESVEAEVKAHRLQAKGGDLSALTTTQQHVRDASVCSLVAENDLARLVEREDRKAAAR